MKKILAFIMVILMLASLGILSGCKETQGDTNTTEDNTKVSPVAGVWIEISTDDEYEWSMNSKDTLHITEVIGESRYTKVCKYTYDEQTGAFEYVALNASDTFKGTAVVDEKSMKLVSDDKSVTIVLRKTIDY